MNGHAAVAALLLEKGASVDAATKDGRTALMLAAGSGHEAVAAHLLEKGVSVDAADQDGDTALIWAAMNGHAAVAKLLLEKGASIDAANNDGDTAQIVAARHEAVVALLKKHRERLAGMVKALYDATDAASLQAAMDGAAGAAGTELETALSVARSRLKELQNSEMWKAERVAAGVDHLMPKERPDEHLCAISKEPMVDPVVAEDGFTYERSQIEEWLQNSRTSPKTREEMGTDLRPNRDLGRLIREWEKQEHERCMALAAPAAKAQATQAQAQAQAQAAAPPLAQQDTSDLKAELQRREQEKAAAASSSAAAEVAPPPPVRQSTEALEAEIALKQGELQRRKKAKAAASSSSAAAAETWAEAAAGDGDDDAASSSGKRQAAPADERKGKAAKK
jgi:hypothetical protein